MDPDSEPDTQQALSLQWKSYKLVQDPAIRRVNNKIYRYDGVHFSVPDSGFPPVGDLRDPRPRRTWSRHTEMALPVPKFKLDEFYVGPIPLKEVTFARLNDNIKEPFLAEMCAKFGEVEEMEILFHPKTRKHLGLARVLFTSTRGAKDTVKHLHNTSVMGNIIHAQLDIKGQQRQKYYDLIVSGSYTPQTVPTGGKALTERFQPPAPTQPDTSSDIRRRLSSEIAGLAAGLAAGVPALTPGSTTPCSVDTGFSEQRLDTTPSSMGGPYTPGSSASSQGGGTPYTPRSVSQDSGYAVARQVGYSAGPLTNSYPPQDMLPSSSCSSSTVSSSVGAYKAPRYSEDPHAPPQDPYQRCRPTYPPTGHFRPNETLLYPTYPNSGGAGQHMAHHPAMPPPLPGPQYEQPPLADRDRERDRDSGGRYGAGGIGSRRSSYHEANSSSKYSHHSHHSERERGYRRDSLGSREHGRHRNHHSHNHSSSSSSSSRRRSSHDRDSRERDRDSDYSNSSDPRFNSHRSSSNSLSPPPSAYPSYSSSKDQPPPHNPSVSSRLEPSSVYRAQPSGAGTGERGSVSDNKDPRSHHTPLPPPPPPPLPPASVIAAAVAETLSALDFGQESPVREETWTKPKRRPTTPPPPPQHPSTPPSSPPHSSIASSSTSPSSTSLPHHLPSSTSLSPPPQRDSSSPEPDSTNESLPFVYHSSSLDSRIEMLLKEQKAKFSFLPSDEDEEEDRKEERQREKAAAAGEGVAGKGGAAGEGRSNKQREQDGEKDRRRKQGGGGGGQQRRKGERDRDGRRGRKQRTGGEGRKSPTVVAPATPSSTFPPRIPTTDDHASLHGTGPLQGETSQPEPIDPRTRQGAQTPPYNGKSQSSPHSSGEDMEISDEDEEHTITAVTTHHATPSSVSSPSSSQAPLPSQTDPSGSPSDPIQHFGTSMPAPPIPSYTPHLPPPGFSLQPPPPPCIPPPLAHMELHPEYPPPMPPHMYDYASSMELMNQYSGGAPMSFQMQTQMLSRLHQLRMSSSNGTAAPGDAPPSDYYHSMPPPPHPYMDQEGGGYGQDQHYMPPHMPYAYPGPSQMPHHHAIPPPHTGWAPHVLPEHYAYHTPTHYGTMPPVEGETQYGAEGDPQMPLLTENPHEATVQLVLATLIQEMKSIMQRDLNRKMVENIAFGTFDEWWERKETKAKPFQTMVRGVAAVRDEDKKEENKASSKPREPLMSLVDWAKSGGMEGFSLRGALRLPSFKVKRKEPLELAEVGEMKRPKTPPEDDDEDSYHAKGLEGRMADGEGHRAERDSRRRKKKTRSRKPWDLDSEGEETSDGSSSDKEDEEEGSDKSEDEALSVDSDDESLSSSTESSSSSTSSSSSSSEDEEEGEQAGSGLDTMDESTMDSTALDTEKEDDREKSAAAVPKAPLSAEIKAEIAASKKDSSTLSSNARLPAPRPSSPIVIVPPLKKRRKTVSFSTGDSNYKPHLPTVPLSSPPSTASPLFSHIKSHLPDSILIASTPGTTPSKTLSLLPFASKPGEGNALSPSPVLTVPSPVRPEDSKKSPVPLVSPPITPTKSPNKRGASPKSPAPVWVCRTVQNLPMDHASMVKMAFEEAPPPVTKGRGRGRPRTVSLSTPTHPPSFHTLREEEEEEEEEEERLQRLRLSEQLGASSLLQLGSAPTADLSVLADVALKLDPDAGDSEETETSDEAEEQKMEEEMLLSSKALPLVMDPQGRSALQEHNYSKAPFHLIPAQKRSVSKQEPGVLLPADFNHHAISGVLEAPEEVIGEPLPSRDRHQAEYLSGMGLLCEDGDMAKASVLTPLTPSAKRKGMAARGSELEEMGKEKNKKRRRKDKENLELQQMKKQKEHQTKKQKRKLEEVDLEEDVDVEQLEPGELSNTEDEEEEEWDDVRKSERLFLQEAGLTSSQRWSKPIPATEPATFDQRSEFEQMTILYDIWNSGLDMEDMTLLKTTYEKLLQDDHSTDWLNDTHWVHHTVTNIPNPRRKKKSSDGQLREHVTGCARSEGYYAISRKEKDVYLDLELPEQALLEAADYDASGSNRLLSERRSEQRRLLSAIGIPAVMDSDLLKLNQLKFRKKKLRFGRSRIHEWGLFTMEPIAADEMVIEYVGQNIRQMVADNREKRYAQQGIGSSYLFRVDHDTIIDATKLGNLARFINHCCTPNCYAKVITIESQKKIVIYSKQAIGMNEEITYDYKFPLEENKIPCLCGTENCRGTLN